MRSKVAQGGDQSESLRLEDIPFSAMFKRAIKRATVDLGVALGLHVAAGDPHAQYVLEAATPGGELGNTYANPTVDALHSGSTHAATQAAAEATAAAALAGHVAAGDPHTGYRLESVPIAAADVAADVATQAELDAVAATVQNPHHTVRAAAGVPSGAPTGTELPIAVDTTAVTGGVYYWTGAAWVLAASI